MVRAPAPLAASSPEPEPEPEPEEPDDGEEEDAPAVALLVDVVAEAVGGFLPSGVLSFEEPRMLNEDIVD